ncbi:exported hypothetical protein [Candidatus Sulfopaludibacter sp. SbA3]|nr:exported hypothetical protein [Candidatus Sulfopaludibacter sp. SbA3]
MTSALRITDTNREVLNMTKWLLALIAAFALTASAADVAGTWKASVETPNGTFESTFAFKVDGAKLTGTVTGQMGEAPISEGRWMAPRFRSPSAASTMARHSKSPTKAR